MEFLRVMVFKMPSIELAAATQQTCWRVLAGVNNGLWLPCSFSKRS